MGKREKGALTVEACVILMIFMFGMLAILNIINVVRTQVIVQNALNQTAKEVSQYSYVLYRFGYLDYMAATNKNAAEFEKKIDAYTNPPDATTAMENLTGIMKQFSNDGGNALMDELVKGLFAEASTSATDWINDYMTDKMVKRSMEKCMETLGNGSDYLQKMGIAEFETEPDFCEYCVDKNHKIIITVQYKVKYTFPFIDVSFDIPIRLSAVTTAWAGGVE